MADSSEELIAKAVSFLSSATGRSTQEKEQFLLEKGLTQEQIQEAYRRIDDSKGRLAGPGAGGMAGGMAGTPGPQPPGPTPPVGPTAPSAPLPPRPAPPTRPVTPVTPSYPSTSPGYAPPYGGYQAPYPPPGPPMAPMMYQGYPLPLEPPSTGGPWWAWLLGGLGAGLVGTYLANPFRLRPEDGEFFTETEKPKQESQGDLTKQSDTGGEPDTKASYEELLSLLRQQSEEAKANVSMCAKTLQQTQEQHQKMFAEMQKALQNTQQKSSKPQTMELSASTIQALATMIQNAWSGGEPENGNAPSLPSVTSGPALAKGSPSATASPPPEGSSAPALSLRESFEATNASLQRLVTDSNSKQEATKSLNTVAMILSNFLKDPNSDRNRKVNTSGARFSEIFRNNSAAGELLKLAGFQYQHPNFVFNETGQINSEGAQRTLDLVQEAQRNIDQTWSSRDRAAPNSPAPAAAAPAPVTAPAPAAAPAPVATPAPAAAVAPAASASLPASSEAARPWAPRQPPPGAPQAWVNMTRDINEDPQTVQPSAQPAQPVQPAPTPAHPAETLPPAIAHPAESEARPVAQPQPAPAQPSYVAPSQPMHLPIAHPAEATPVEDEESQPQSGG